MLYQPEDFLPVGGADVSDVMLNMNHLHSPARLINVLFFFTTKCLFLWPPYNTSADFK